MGVLDRVSTILRANVNSLLDGAEDPQKMLDQYIRDMSESIREAKGRVAEMIADEKRLKADLDRSNALAAEWEGKAELAVSKGADDLAREALKRKSDQEANGKIYETQWTAQKEAVAKLKTDLETLEDRYEDTLRKRDELIARYKRAQAQKAVSRTSGELSTYDPTQELERMEQRIRMEEARASAHAEIATDSIDQRFEALEEDDEIEKQLAALKEKAKGPQGT